MVFVIIKFEIYELLIDTSKTSYFEILKRHGPLYKGQRKYYDI